MRWGFEFSDARPNQNLCLPIPAHVTSMYMYNVCEQRRLWCACADAHLSLRRSVRSRDKSFRKYQLISAYFSGTSQLQWQSKLYVGITKEPEKTDTKHSIGIRNKLVIEKPDISKQDETHRGMKIKTAFMKFCCIHENIYTVRPTIRLITHFYFSCSSNQLRGRRQ